VLRAVIKAGPVLKGVHYDTGYLKEDMHTTRLINMLVDNQVRCPFSGVGAMSSIMVSIMIAFFVMHPPASLCSALISATRDQTCI
jgi:hypothetical protein